MASNGSLMRTGRDVLAYLANQRDLDDIQKDRVRVLSHYLREFLAVVKNTSTRHLGEDMPIAQGSP